MGDNQVNSRWLLAAQGFTSDDQSITLEYDQYIALLTKITELEALRACYEARLSPDQHLTPEQALRETNLRHYRVGSRKS